MHYDRNQILVENSKESIDAAFRIDPELPEAYIALAEYYYHGFMDYPNALVQLQTASKLMPDHPDCSFLKAAVYRRMGVWEKATIEFENAHEADPGSTRNIQDLALTYYLTSNYEKALQLINDEIMRSPDVAGIYAQKIHCYLMRDGNTLKAREVLADAALLNISETAVMKSVFYFSSLLDIYDGNYQQALDFLASSDWEGYNGLNWYQPKEITQAMIFEFMQLPEEAKTCYDSARMKLEVKLKELPDDPRVLSSLGIVYAGLGDKENAIQTGNKAIKLCSLNMDAIRGQFRAHDLAWMYVKVESYDSALEQIEILLSNPGPFSAPLLKLDPRWEPLWDHPEFIRLTNKFTANPS
jgi:tetratricopeptide (TPR) repeat protein